MSDDKREQLFAEVRGLISRMPQPDQFHRTAAFFAVAAQSSGLTTDEAIRAFLRFVRTEKQVPNARLDLAPDDREWVTEGMDQEDTLAVVHAFMKGIATMIAGLDEDLREGRTTEAVAIEALDAVSSIAHESLTPEQVKLFGQMSAMLKDDIQKAVEYRELLKNPQ